VLILNKLAVNIIRLQNGRLGVACFSKRNAKEEKNPPSEEVGYRTWLFGHSRCHAKQKSGVQLPHSKKTERLPGANYTHEDRLSQVKIGGIIFRSG